MIPVTAFATPWSARAAAPRVLTSALEASPVLGVDDPQEDEDEVIRRAREKAKGGGK